MAKLPQLINPVPLNEPIEELPPDPVPFEPNEDIKQLRVDVINVVEGRVDINTFPEEYQERIRHTYQFSAIHFASDVGVVAERIRETLDIV